jgi:hypothetical protein
VSGVAVPLVGVDVAAHDVPAPAVSAIVATTVVAAADRRRRSNGTDGTLGAEPVGCSETRHLSSVPGEESAHRA